MDTAFWAYPWDILDRGIKSFIKDCLAIGVDQVNLATNYHAVHSFSPGNPSQRSYFAQASSYFQPAADYGTLEPIPAAQMGTDDWVERITTGLTDAGIGVAAWTIGVHNSRLGLSHPELTLTSPYGDPLPFALCPSQPAVQSYLCTLVNELDERGRFEAIELEAFDYFHGSGFGWHHDKVFINRGPLGEFLTGLCFCNACQGRALDAGIDVVAAQETCVRTLDAIADGDGPPADPLEWVRDEPAVNAYVNCRMEAVHELFESLRVTTDHDLRSYIGLLEVGDEWMFGVDTTTLGEFVDSYTVIAYEPTPTAVLERLERARDISGNTPVHVGIQPGPPVIDDRQAVVDIVETVRDAGVERLSFYNYGPLPERSLRWVADAIDTI